MGWWGCDIMDGDEPLDIQSQIEDICGINEGVINERFANTLNDILKYVRSENEAKAFSCLGYIILKNEIAITEELKNEIIEKARIPIFYFSKGRSKTIADIFKKYDISGHLEKKQSIDELQYNEKYYAFKIEKKILDISGIYDNVDLPKEVFEDYIPDILEELYYENDNYDPINLQVFGFMLMQCGAKMDEISYKIILEAVDNDNWDDPDRIACIAQFRANVV